MPQQMVRRLGVSKGSPQTVQIFAIIVRRGWLRAFSRQASEQNRGGRPAPGTVATKLTPHGQMIERAVIRAPKSRVKTIPKNRRAPSTSVAGSACAAGV
jgi:hypothetical protein